MLNAQEQRLVQRALAAGLLEPTRTPAYGSARLCTLISLALALPTLGTSLLVVPLLWVLQHDRTATNLARLQRELEAGGPVGQQAPQLQLR
jgi:uncharacterized iron-regulated membrane protein